MPQRAALIIGNSTYTDGDLSRLVTPEADTAALAEVLGHADIGGFDSVTPLVNQPCSVVREAIARFYSNRRKDDLLLLYFSGHGVLDEHGRLFLAVADTKRTLLTANGLAASFISDEMDRCDSRRLVLILDCCHSGAFVRGSKGAGLGGSVGTRSAFEGCGFGRCILTASDATQYAWEGDQLIGAGQQSVFTKHLVAGLRSGAADTNGDGIITIEELYEYIHEQVINESSRQTPTKTVFGQKGEFLIARNPRPVPKAAVLPEELTDAIGSPLAGVRKGAVSELGLALNSDSSAVQAAARRELNKLLGDENREVADAARAVLAGTTTAPKTPTKPATVAPTTSAPRVPPTAAAGSAAAPQRIHTITAPARTEALPPITPPTSRPDVHPHSTWQAQQPALARPSDAPSAPLPPPTLSAPSGPPGAFAAPGGVSSGMVPTPVAVVASAIGWCFGGGAVALIAARSGQIVGQARSAAEFSFVATPDAGDYLVHLLFYAGAAVLFGLFAGGAAAATLPLGSGASALARRLAFGAVWIGLCAVMFILGWLGIAAAVGLGLLSARLCRGAQPRLGSTDSNIMGWTWAAALSLVVVLVQAAYIQAVDLSMELQEAAVGVGVISGGIGAAAGAITTWRFKRSLR